MAAARQVVGPSGHATRPGGSTLEAYRRCLPAHSLANRHVKVIVNLEYALRVGDDPHTFLYLARPPRAMLHTQIIALSMIGELYDGASMLTCTRAPGMLLLSWFQPLFCPRHSSAPSGPARSQGQHVSRHATLQRAE
jgi:hypothetical protein